MNGAYRVSQEEKGKARIQHNDYYQKAYGANRADLKIIAKHYGYIKESRLGKVI